MRYNGENMKAVLDDHELWLDTQSVRGSRADFYSTLIVGKDARLFTGRNLGEACFSYAKIFNANFKDAVLTCASFVHADAQDANFTRAHLANAALNYARLTESDFTGAYTAGCCFFEADLRKAINPPDLPFMCPREGAFIGWKKAITDDNNHKTVIIKLLIPKDARRLSGTSRQCRADKAKVLEIQDITGSVRIEGIVARSSYDPEFVYKLGEIVRPERPFDENRYHMCSSGIHFFMDRLDAVRYPHG